MVERGVVNYHEGEGELGKRGPLVTDVLTPDVD